jgi:3-methyl-2-oxobutanoate hydroxymethyltransferase
MSETQTSGTSVPRRRATVADFSARAAGGQRLVVVTAYDATFARLVDEAGVDAILVGDSVGNVVAGYETTLPVTLEHMIYHGAAVRRGAPHACLIVDMPFLSYQVSVQQALTNCGRVMQRTGAQAVKVEGGGEGVARSIKALVGIGVPVMGHLGFTPQSVHTLGGFRVQGRGDEAAARLLAEARRLEEAGVFGLVLELVPAELATLVTEALSVPTIGIGAGAGCTGQVLVLYDLIGLTDTFTPKYLKRYADGAGLVRDAIRAFGEEVRGGTYPDASRSF